MSTDAADRSTRESRRSGALVRAMRWMENLSDTQYAYFLLIPVFLLLGAIALYPLLRTFELSLLDTRLGQVEAQFIGLQNYVGLFTGAKDPVLPGSTTFLPDSLAFGDLITSALVVTVIFSVVSVFFETLIGLGQALVLDQDFRGRKWARAAIIIPWAVPIVIQGMMFYLLFNSNIGFLTPPLAELGILRATNTLNDTASSLFIVIVADIWKTSAFMALLILAGLQSIDRGLYDVAKVAGASKWQQFKLITFPLILPTIGVAVLFRTVQAMRVYGVIHAVAGCETVPSLSCMVVATFLDRQGTSAAIAFATAAIIGSVVMILIWWQGEDAI